MPPRSGLSRAVNFTKPTVHYFATSTLEEGRLWMAAMMKATIDRDESKEVITTYQQKTISLAKARARKERPPALRGVDEEVPPDMNESPDFDGSPAEPGLPETPLEGDGTTSGSLAGPWNPPGMGTSAFTTASSQTANSSAPLQHPAIRGSQGNTSSYSHPSTAVDALDAAQLAQQKAEAAASARLEPIEDQITEVTVLERGREVPSAVS
ncbi:hypothetical protein MRB53_039812 [Persea americana]|nr:hypothetical protein MRB53_039812 [Persea americana]